MNVGYHVWMCDGQITLFMLNKLNFRLNNEFIAVNGGAIGDKAMTATGRVLHTDSETGASGHRAHRETKQGLHTPQGGIKTSMTQPGTA